MRIPAGNRYAKSPLGEMDACAFESLCLLIDPSAAAASG
jgi:hypothetical protein